MARFRPAAVLRFTFFILTNATKLAHIWICQPILVDIFRERYLITDNFKCAEGFLLSRK